jgi:hypothetical protein
MYVRCTHCGYDNSPEYRFCGMCGASLAHPPAPEAQPPIRDVRPVGTGSGNVAPEFTPEAAPVNGPSFLGLADEPSENPKHEFHYLYEDEPPRSHAGLIMVLLVIAIAGAAIGWQWHHSGFPFNSQRTPGQSASSSESGSASATRDTHVDNPATGASSVAPANPEKSVPLPTDAAPSDNASSTGTPSGNPSTSNNNDNDAAPNSGTTSAKGHESSAERSTAAKKAASNESNTNESNTEEAETTPPAAVPARSRVTKTSSRTPSKPQARRAVEDQEPAPVASPDADLELAGEKYLYGTGVPQNCARANSSLRTAAQHGNTKAQTVLGTMYATGHCVTRDLPTAYRWFARALHKDPQNSRISADLQVLWRQMSPQEKQLATANSPQPE